MEDRLEIIGPQGEVKFHNLNLAKGFTNIGQDSRNDIVIPDPNIAPFQAVLVHQQKPNRLVLLSDQGWVRLDGQPLPLHRPQTLHHMARLQLGDYMLILFEYGQEGASAGINPVFLPALPTPGSNPPPPAASPPIPMMAQTPLPPVALHPAAVQPPGTRPEPSPQPESQVNANSNSSQPPAAARLTTAIPDQEDDVILTELLISEVAIDVEQTATYQLTIINGGELVATFAVRVEGLDESWITISPPNVNLYEGNRTTVTITVTPPRQSTSYAGPHYFALTVTSFNYPGRVSRRGATLVINPYYEFGVGEINPRQQSISWFRRAGKASITITNKGNSNTLFQVDGRDDERGCNFEFQVPGEGVNLANQAEFRIPPDETMPLPLLISPNSRQLVGLRKRSYPFTITTAMPEGAQSPRSLLGQLKTAPLIGPLILLLLALLLLVLIVIIFKPRISTFNVDGSTKRAITAGQSATLYWKGSPFTRLIIPELSSEPLDSPQGNIEVEPTANASYQLKGDNWLSRLSPQWFGVEPRLVSIILTPVPPIINTFGGDKQDIVSGDSVLLSWQVEGADQVNLINQADGNPKPLPGNSGNQDTGPLDRETTYYLEADNIYIATPIRSDPFVVKVSTPTPTPLPTPAIVKFFANPPAVVAGENTTIEWAVEGTDKVSVLGIGEGLPASQSISQAPLENTNYVLNAANGSSAAKPQSITVWVTPPTPTPTTTPEPDAPEIVLFSSSDDTLIQGQATPTDDEKDIVLSWQTRGIVTNVELNGGPDIGIFSNLDPEGSMPMTINKNTVFVLTAFNQDKATSQNLQVEVVEATPTPKPTDTPEPPPPTETPTPTPPPPTIFFFKAEAKDTADAGQVVSLGGDQYTVVVGTDIKLSWQVSDDAAEVSLSPVNNSYGPGEGFLEMPDFSTNDTTSYQLFATNPSGTTQSNVNIQVIIGAMPQPPSTVGGTTAGTDNTITWDWNGSEDILGFRVYRADVPPGNNFSAVYTAGSATPFQWTDTGADCNRIYYVVTLYSDVNLNPIETGPSLASWASCP